ncbi:MAG: Smr/MutS family protein [Magnetovibrionaceae bacterium]
MASKGDKTPKPKKQTGLRDDDLATWRAFAEGVTPLEGRSVNETPPVPDLPPRRRPDIRRPDFDFPTRAPNPSEPAMSHGSAPGLDNRTKQKLRRGKIDIEGRLDLHGMTQDQAFGALTRFLASSRSRGRRAVLIITGKGLRRDGTIGALRQAVPRWLNEEPNRAHVTAFDSAQARDGGEGALYVLLRRADPKRRDGGR